MQIFLSQNTISAWQVSRPHQVISFHSSHCTLSFCFLSRSMSSLRWLRESMFRSWRCLSRWSSSSSERLYIWSSSWMRRFSSSSKAAETLTHWGPDERLPSDGIFLVEILWAWLIFTEFYSWGFICHEVSIGLGNGLATNRQAISWINEFHSHIIFMRPQ